MSQASIFVSCLGFFFLEFWILGTIPVVPGMAPGTSPMSTGQTLIAGLGLQNVQYPQIQNQPANCAWWNIFCNASSVQAAVSGMVGTITFYLAQAAAPIIYVVGAAAQVNALCVGYPWLYALNFLCGAYLGYSVVKGFI